MEYIADTFNKKEHYLKFNETQTFGCFSYDLTPKKKMSRVKHWFDCGALELCNIYYLDDEHRVGVLIHQSTNFGIHWGLEYSLEIYDFDLSRYDMKNIEIYVSSKDKEWAKVIPYRDDNNQPR